MILPSPSQKHVRVFEKTRTYTPLLGEDILQVP